MTDYRRRLFRSVQRAPVRPARRCDVRVRGVLLTRFFTSRFPAGYRLRLEALPDRWLPTDKGVPQPCVPLPDGAVCAERAVYAAACCLWLRPGSPSPPGWLPHLRRSPPTSPVPSPTPPTTGTAGSPP